MELPRTETKVSQHTSAAPSTMPDLQAGKLPLDESVSSLSDDGRKQAPKRRIVSESDSSRPYNNDVKKPKTIMEDVDLSTIEGQLTAHPNMTRDAARTAAKREYNRLNAARARRRNKNMVESLQATVAQLTQRANDLQKHNDALVSQVEWLTQENRLLLLQQQDPTARLLSMVMQQQSPHTLIQQILAAGQSTANSTVGLPPNLVLPTSLPSISETTEQQPKDLSQITGQPLVVMPAANTTTAAALTELPNTVVVVEGSNNNSKGH